MNERNSTMTTLRDIAVGTGFSMAPTNDIIDAIEELREAIGANLTSFIDDDLHNAIMELLSRDTATQSNRHHTWLTENGIIEATE